MSHKHHHDDCCYPMDYGYGYGGYGAGAVAGTTGAGAGYAGGGIRWIYALLILIVIVLQFGRNNERFPRVNKSGCCDGDNVDGYLDNRPFNNQLIDNSVLFIIVVFLLILCAGCFGGGTGIGAGAGYGGGYGY